MDPTFPVAQALAVKDGRIVEVGEQEYRLVDLEGRTVIPGFVDPHCSTGVIPPDELLAIRVLETRVAGVPVA